MSQAARSGAYRPSRGGAARAGGYGPRNDGYGRRGDDYDRPDGGYDPQGDGYGRRPGGDSLSRGAQRTPPRRSPSGWGSLPGKYGIGLVAAAAALGALGTVLTGSQPGTLLSVCLVAGTVAGGFAVRQRASYLVIPAPAIAYLVAALAAGVFDAHSSSHTALALGALQWVAHGFVSMVAATILAIVITAARWRTARRRPGDTPRPGATRRPGATGSPGATRRPGPAGRLAASEYPGATGRSTRSPGPTARRDTRRYDDAGYDNAGYETSSQDTRHLYRPR